MSFPGPASLEECPAGNLPSCTFPREQVKLEHVRWFRVNLIKISRGIAKKLTLYLIHQSI